jgi:glutamate synthase (NADPH/NADH) small chain
MAQPTGFLEHPRQLPTKRPVSERTKDYYEVEGIADPQITVKQATRCMDCGVPFCHQGCPLGNIIPEFNDAVYQGNWKLAYELLISTNNFPEFTGRICPAPCEAACVLGINKDPVAIEYIEKTIIEKAFELGYAVPRKPTSRTGKKIAIVGSGPAGLAAAAQLNQAGHHVAVYERADEIGGLLRYGIPDFKLDKQVLDRRLRLMEEEGIQFITNASVGITVPAEQLREEFDAIVLCGGATRPRDLPLPGRAIKGVHFAMDFLTQQNKRVAGKQVTTEDEIWATGKQVIVIGGGDTGSDCVGTSVRHGAASVTQLEIMPKPPAHRTATMPWPNWPLILRTSTSHEEGCNRQWGILTKEFVAENGCLTGLRIVDVKPAAQGFEEISGTERVLPCELALLAMGFTGPEKNLAESLGLALDDRGNVLCKRYQTSVAGVFAAGDMRRGQSLVVWAISEGREAARAVDEFLMGASVLEEKERGVLALG